MSDIRYQQQSDEAGYAVSLDWLLTPLNLITEGAALQSAVIVALGTDARANETDELPDPDASDRRGWWGDTDAKEIWGAWPIGSKLWLLERAKITGPNSANGDTVARAENYTHEALRPFIEHRIASKLEISAARTDVGRIDVETTLYRGPDEAISLRYADLWDELGRV